MQKCLFQSVRCCYFVQTNWRFGYDAHSGLNVLLQSSGNINSIVCFRYFRCAIQLLRLNDGKWLKLGCRHRVQAKVHSKTRGIVVMYCSRQWHITLMHIYLLTHIGISVFFHPAQMLSRISENSSSLHSWRR